jgi:hypothetical protein
MRVDREPCPFRIVDDAGGAFVFGNSLNFNILNLNEFITDRSRWWNRLAFLRWNQKCS